MEVKSRSIKTEILIAIMGVVAVSIILMGALQYYGESKAYKGFVVEKSLQAFRPVVALATRNINGGNLMNLKNQSAVDMYKTDSEMIYLKMEGMSAGSPKTEFSEAIPPAKIEYEYTKDGVADDKKAFYAAQIAAMGNREVVVDSENMVVYIYKKLEIDNGGRAFAVFSAKELGTIWVKVLSNMILGLILVPLVAFFAARYMGRRISAPILHVAEKITEFTKTLDLGTAVKFEEKNEIGDLVTGFNAHVASLKVLVLEVNNLAGKVNTSANEIAVSVDEQASVSTEQSSSLSEITATMEELSVSSSQIADNANAVAQLSRNMLTETDRSVVSLGSLKDKMDEIETDNKNSINEIMELDRKSKEIGKIMGMINNIADQTKMIAFNAAIEASSAGEAGKRFSVVAGEIRRLADNVMESTGEIQSKIDEIQKAVNRLVIVSEKGAKTVREGANYATATLDDLVHIVAGTKSATDSASQISLSTQQQKTAANQVLTALKEIDQGLHHSSAAIRQTSASAVTMRDLATNLKGILSEFKVNGSPLTNS
ncbi:MAG: methyl-accepting chemotaxis protein [Nitrospinae bacterium]|nr:methyl-accepting chemotaxis protein [Nitrospinota bacterium]